ncbi:hypothetical protein [Actinomyces vulturis]|uniref:hypothetical protein n=1 Tax=Actinomyces vulturis TaxID=1857645 RepID=UPI003CCBEED7
MRGGGYLDTVRENITGLFFESPTPDKIRDAVLHSEEFSWNIDSIVNHAKTFDEKNFHHALNLIVNEHLGQSKELK